MTFTAIAFYTKDTLYEREIEKLAASCADVGIQLETRGYKSKGSWVENCALKPFFIARMLETYGGDLLYLDADARVRQYPTLFDNFEGDIGIHYRQRNPNHKELLSGTIYLRNVQPVQRLIRRWCDYQSVNPGVWDQRVFQKVLEEDTTVKVVNLPPTYTQIYDSMKNAGKPVIEHFQASRRVKKNGLIPEIYPSSRVPDTIAGRKINLLDDGTYSIDAPHRGIERFMDDECIRIDDELRWRVRYNPNASLDELRDQFNGKECYIVGKGPSLDNIGNLAFEPSIPIIGLNEAVLKVESLGLPNFLIGLQQDAKLRDTCYPKKVGIMVSEKAIPFYADKPRVYMFDNQRLGLSYNSLSVVAAITIAKGLGAVGYRLCCFDACINGATGYANFVPYDSTWGGEPERFLHHRKKIERVIKTLPVQWILP